MKDKIEEKSIDDATSVKSTKAIEPNYAGIDVVVRVVDENFNIYETKEKATIVLEETNKKIEILNKFLECLK